MSGRDGKQLRLLLMARQSQAFVLLPHFLFHGQQLRAKMASASRCSDASLPPEEPDAGNLHVRVCERARGQPLALLGGSTWASPR